MPPGSHALGRREYNVDSAHATIWKEGQNVPLMHSFHPALLVPSPAAGASVRRLHSRVSSSSALRLEGAPVTVACETAHRGLLGQQPAVYALRWHVAVCGAQTTWLPAGASQLMPGLQSQSGPAQRSEIWWALRHGALHLRYACELRCCGIHERDGAQVGACVAQRKQQLGDQRGTDPYPLPSRKAPDPHYEGNQNLFDTPCCWIQQRPLDDVLTVQHVRRQ
jgi:hypothetical protein